jgi:predicted dinucleotide-binding enzyme
MKIAVIGKGNMGATLGALATKAGHEVTYGSTSPDAPVSRALDGAALVILAVPYASALALGEDAAVRAALSGKVVVDVTNPLAADYMSLTIGHTTSAAEEIARRLPGARVVKAFNTIFADVLRQRAAGVTTPVTVLVAGDDDEAKRAVAGLAEAFGFAATDAGPLANARYLEPMTELLVQLAYGKGQGTRIGFALVRA